MARPYVLDANAFKPIFNYVIYGIADPEGAVIDTIFENTHIVIDESGKIENEWKSCSCGDDYDALRQWMTNRIAEDQIRYIAVRCEKSLKRDVRALGVPTKDCVYIFAAVSGDARLIISNDIDLFHPEAKTWRSDQKSKIIEDRSGCVCTFMRNNYDTDVVSPLHLREYLA